jgi:hypothetical protein
MSWSEACDRRLIKKLISLFEEDMYDRKEMVVERLQELAERYNKRIHSPG